MVTSSSTDNTMADSLDKVAERLALLEQTMAKGFYDLDERVTVMGSKFDIQTEAIREDLQKTAATLNAFAEESRRTAESMRKEHAADRAVLIVTLKQHARRIYDVETQMRGARSRL